MPESEAASRTQAVPARSAWPPVERSPRVVSSAYIDQNAAGYHFDHFRKVASRVPLEGRRVLEIGSDYHLISARLFALNGASRVVATNIGDWRSDEPMPGEIEFLVGDVADAALEPGSFDVIYGLAVLEHIPDFSSVVAACKRLLAPDGVIYLQGAPVWSSNLGHHVWYRPEDDGDMRERFAQGGSPTSSEMTYSFTDSERNPIPDWAHLALSPHELSALLTDRGVPWRDAAGVVNYVYNLSGDATGSCSNFKCATEIISAFASDFDVFVDSAHYGTPPNDFYQQALRQHSRYDLDTFGLEIWARHTDARRCEEQQAPRVALVVDLPGDLAQARDLLTALEAQDYPNLRIVTQALTVPDEVANLASRAGIDNPRVLVANSGGDETVLSTLRQAGAKLVVLVENGVAIAEPAALRTLINDFMAERETGAKLPGLRGPYAIDEVASELKR